jgi:hypothetical protein
MESGDGGYEEGNSKLLDRHNDEKLVRTITLETYK